MRLNTPEPRRKASAMNRRAATPGGDAAATSLRRVEIERWEDEGGAAATPPAPDPRPGTAPLADGEIAQLRVRVGALEGLVLALLAQASVPQRAAAARMAGPILPRPGRTPHALTIRAAARITQLVTRARRLASAR